MKKIYSGLLLFSMIGASFAQWSPSAMSGKKIRQEVEAKQYYSLDIDQLRTQLTKTEKAGKSAKGTIINVPTLNGKIEKFEVFSAPVMEESLATKYQLGSYIGVGVDDKSKWIRFSISPTDFQSMVFSDGKYQFIEPQNSNKSVYAVFPKSKKSVGNHALECGIDENFLKKKQIDKLASKSVSTESYTNFQQSSEQKFRTYRLAISTTAEYSNYFGGVAGAMEAINATMTRVNGVFEKDFAIHLMVQNFPQLIFTDSTNDPYSPSNVGAGEFKWSLELQQTLTSTIGNSAYDVGHLFGDTGGGGNAGDIGTVCRNPANANDGLAKGSGFTSPKDGIPKGDAFDIDFVAHEMGHQLGAWHTYAYIQELGNIAQMEPGSGSTIMGYAGITGSYDVQSFSDPYFHAISIKQVHDYVNTQTCGTVMTVANTPPSITALQSKSIPKGTAFVLTAAATDKENDALTYTWEQYDNATTAIKTVTGNEISGAKFRSLLPTTNPTRYFPKLASVLQGNLSNQPDWEAVSNVARDMNFAITVRDNNVNAMQQQTSTEYINVKVGGDGPFKINTTKVFKSGVSNITWDVVNTNAAPYNVTNVKIDYSTDNGATWVVVANSTANDGTEVLAFPNTTIGNTIHIRVSAIDNIFYAVSKATVTNLQACDGSAPLGLTVSDINGATANVSWNQVENATYVLQYKKATDTTWKTLNLSTNATTLTGLDLTSNYQVQVAAVCTGTTGAYSSIVNFNTNLSTNDVDQAKLVNIHPNPVVDVINIVNVSLKATYKIYNFNGQLVKQGNVNDSKINVTNLASGAYIISINDDTKATNLKFLKK